MATEMNAAFRISTSAAKHGCEYDKYNDKNKYPYINFLPFTCPSQAAQQYDTEKYELFAPTNIFDIEAARKSLTIRDARFPIQDTKNCRSIKEKINGIDCDWIEYKGSNINNGIILQLHGGGYCLSTHIKLFAQSELLSKLTGMVCLCINYSKAPEYPLPQCVNEIVSIYKYLLNAYEKRIFLAGASAGGGLILLTLQELNRLNICQPCGVWMDSTWSDLAFDGITKGSKERNLNIDLLTGGGKWLLECAEMAVGNLDTNRKRINTFDLKDEKFSPLYADFNGLCPMYFTVCATEILFDDTMFAAEKAFKSGVNVRVDIAPYMMHGFAYKVNILPEAYNQTVVAAEWMMNQLRKQISLQSKL